MLKSVSVVILADKDKNFTFDELEHLASTAGINTKEIAEMIKVDPAIISKWKKSSSHIPFPRSYCIQSIVIQNYF